MRRGYRRRRPRPWARSALPSAPPNGVSFPRRIDSHAPLCFNGPFSGGAVLTSSDPLRTLTAGR